MAARAVESSGFALIPLTPEQVTLLDKAWVEFNGFGNFWMFQRVERWKELPLSRSPVIWDVRDNTQETLHRMLLGCGTKHTSATKMAERYTGDKLAFRHRGVNHGRATLIPKSGLGMGTSYFEGAAHLTLQLQIARDHLAPLYRERGEALDPSAVRAVEAGAAALGTDLSAVAALWRELSTRDPRRADYPPVTGRARALQRWLDAVRRALCTRRRRVQGQVPIRSILQFVRGSPRLETLFHLATHPVHGTVTGDWSDSLPFRHPFIPVKGKTPSFASVVTRMNAVCSAIHSAYSHPDQPSITFGPWVSHMRPLLDTFRAELGLDTAFVPFQLVHPETDNHLLLWNGYHSTVGHWVRGGKKQSGGMKRAVFVDAVPRSVFSEAVWSLWWSCNRVAIVDFGAGSLRGSEWGVAYCREMGLPLGAETVEDRSLWPMLGAPGGDRDRDVVVIPERFRLKWEGQWDNLHIDHTPLPDALLRAASSLTRNTRDPAQGKTKRLRLSPT